MSQTQSQRRAAQALKEVRQIENLSDAEKNRFRAYSNSLPAMVQMNGLGQTAAFCRSRKGTTEAAYELHYGVMSRWLVGDGQPYSDHQDLLEAVTSSGMDEYRAAQTEVLAYLEWVKRFSQAFLPAEKADDSKDADSDETDPKDPTASEPGHG